MTSLLPLRKAAERGKANQGGHVDGASIIGYDQHWPAYTASDRATFVVDCNCHVDNLKGLPAVGATPCGRPVTHRMWRQGDHKGRPYIILHGSPYLYGSPSRCSDPFRLADAGDWSC